MVRNLGAASLRVSINAVRLPVIFHVYSPFYFASQRSAYQFGREYLIDVQTNRLSLLMFSFTFILSA